MGCRKILRGSKEMNAKELGTFLEKAKCIDSLKKLEELIIMLRTETCDVCIHGEENGCSKCEVGEFLGETPY